MLIEICCREPVISGDRSAQANDAGTRQSYQFLGTLFRPKSVSQLSGVALNGCLALFAYQLNRARAFAQRVEAPRFSSALLMATSTQPAVNQWKLELLDYSCLAASALISAMATRVIDCTRKSFEILSIMILVVYRFTPALAVSALCTYRFRIE